MFTVFETLALLTIFRLRMCYQHILAAQVLTNLTAAA